MSDLDLILKNIRDAITDYELLELVDTKRQSECLRKLSCNLYYLEGERVNAYNKWLGVYYECNETSNAAKEKRADSEVQELYLIRRVMTGGHNALQSLRSTISNYKKER